MDTASLLGDEASSLLDYKATAFPKERLTAPGPDFLDEVFAWSDRTPAVLRNLGTLYNHGRLGGTGCGHAGILLHERCQDWNAHDAGYLPAGADPVTSGKYGWAGSTRSRQTATAANALEIDMTPRHQRYPLVRIGDSHAAILPWIDTSRATRSNLLSR